MGIKGIYGEVGPGERIAFSKLAIEKFEETGRPLRIAIDISIWQFQIQAGQGGSNPAIRTLYYRLLRLLSVSVQPIFVFDGPHKPTFKRNKRVGNHGAMLPNMMAKQLLKLFGFQIHNAPGEAEAECALLQREGIVDAVLSEDVDTLMFGSGLTLRNWSSENAKGNKSPTHVSVYDAVKTKCGKAGLDREGMILVALMSGGDYITEGIPGCGVKTACEAARAGFGKSLCRLSRADTEGLEQWRKDLAHELQTNESKFFKNKHKTLKIPENFPNKEVLGYYTHPVVSSAIKIQKMRDEIAWDGEVDVAGLRIFVADAFDWVNKGGARKFIRGLAPALLTHKLRVRADRRDSGYGDVILTAMNEMELVRAICGKRTHISSDGIPELRIIYHPLDIVGIDLEDEHDDSEDYGRDGLAPMIDDDQIEEYQSDKDISRAGSPAKRAPSQYDPTQPDKLWIPETIAKVGVPLKVEDYEECLRNPKNYVKAKAAAQKAATKGGMPNGAIDKFVTVSKAKIGTTDILSGSKSTGISQTSREPSLLPIYLAPSLKNQLESPDALQLASNHFRSSRSSRQAEKVSSDTTIVEKSKGPSTRTRRKAATAASTARPPPTSNPWSFSQSAASLSKTNPTITKPTNHANSKATTLLSSLQTSQIIDLSLSSPPSSFHPTCTKLRRKPSPSPTRTQKHRYSISPPSNLENSLPHSHSAEKLGSRSHLTTRHSSNKDPCKPWPGKEVYTPASTSKPNVYRPSVLEYEEEEEEKGKSVAKNSSTASQPPGFKSRARSSEDNPSERETERAVEREHFPELPTLDEIFSSPAPTPRRQSSPNNELDQTHISLISSPPPALPLLPIQIRRGKALPPPLPNLEDQDSSNIIQRTKGLKVKKFIIPRESLPGAWKMLDEEEMDVFNTSAKIKVSNSQGSKGLGNGKAGEERRGRGRAWRMSQVEIVDLSGD
ncbi:hypothetical protein BGZ60DRAFT_430815 [Tricladium varicosporioides]|nr:hypothetical protein BGZ60DRAFT_430815 [Hymenoscyphus varicosporioides]